MKKILQFINAIAIVVPFTLTAESQSASDAALLTSTNIMQAIKSIPLSAAVDQPLRTLNVGTANVGIFVVHRPQEPDQGCTIEHDTLVNDNTTSIFFLYSMGRELSLLTERSRIQRRFLRMIPI